MTTSSIEFRLTLDLETRLFITSANKLTGLISINSPFLAVVNGDLE